MFLIGEFHHTFDDKFRLTIPSRFREEYADGIFVVRGFDQNLMMLTAPAFEALYKHVMDMNILDSKARQLRRYIFGKGSQAELDKSGRILIPEDLRTWAGLETNVTIVGQGNYLEVWNPELLDAEDDQNEAFDNERFIALNISTQ